MREHDASVPGVAILGGDVQGGIYVLRIRLAKDASVRFGRLRGGEPIPLPAGDYLYVGSARSSGNARSLARRLLRHATRTGRRRSHGIRRTLAVRLQAAGLIEKGDGVVRRKCLRWHIDYLLDLYAAEISGVAAVRTDCDLERMIARKLAAYPGMETPCTGLGASDDPGASHLLYARDDERMWERVVTELKRGLQMRV